MTEAAPRLMVLSYVGANATPTRVRRLAIIGTSVTAGIYVLMASLASAGAVTEVRAVVTLRMRVPPGSWSPVVPAYRTPAAWSSVYAHAAAAYPETYVALISLALAAAGVIAVVGVARLRRWACVLAFCLAIPVTLMLCVMAASLIAMPLSLLIDPVSGERTEAVWLLGVGVPLIGLAMAVDMLTLNLMACLNWMWSHPVVEMPKRKFLS